MGFLNIQYRDDNNTLITDSKNQPLIELHKHKTASLCAFLLFLSRSYYFKYKCFDNCNLNETNPLKELVSFRYQKSIFYVDLLTINKTIGFSAKELVNIEEDCYSFLSSISNINVQIVKSIDVEMLYQLVLSSYFFNITKIKTDYIKTKSFRVLVTYKGKKMLKNITYHPVYMFYNDSNKKEYYREGEINYIGRTSTERAFDVLNHINDEDFFNKTSVIIVLGKSNYLLDGAHRIALLYKLRGKNYKVKVSRFYISNFNLTKEVSIIKRLFKKVRRFYGRISKINR